MGYARNNDGTINVHVTSEQREFMLVLVNRRLNDIARKNVSSLSSARLQEVLNERTELEKVKKELQEAGS